MTKRKRGDRLLPKNRHDPHELKAIDRLYDELNRGYSSPPQINQLGAVLPLSQLTAHDHDDKPSSDVDKMSKRKPHVDAQQNGHGSPKQNDALSRRQGGLNPHQQHFHTTSLKQKAQSLLQIRKALPIWAHVDEIKAVLRRNEILLLVGETGSGKSTQVPQMLLEEAWCQPKSVSRPKSSSPSPLKHEKVKAGGCIAITQPRRVAAISLAKRVAEEMGTPCGSSASPASQVGYSVRFDHNAGPNTRIKFLTEGMLLREMARDPWLRGYSAVVVDEVHERGIDVDLVLGFLKKLVDDGIGMLENRGGLALRVVVMSATADMLRVKDFFEQSSGNGPYLLNGTHDNEDHGQNDAPVEDDDDEEWAGFSSDVESQRSDDATVSATKTNLRKPLTNGITDHKINSDGPRTGNENGKVAESKTSRVSICHIEGRQYPVQTFYLPEPTQDFVDGAYRTIWLIHHKEPLPGDILVFVTGQETVESLETLCNALAMALPVKLPELPKLQVLPLFAALPQAAQQKVFHPAPPNTRKVIIATNIAETSVTVSGVRFVIDCGKAKIKQFRSQIGLESLLVKPISKSAAIQRTGRAGREAPGQCYRMYTEPEYEQLQVANTPEILRCDLSHSLLMMKARGIDDVLHFPFLDSPSKESLQKALLHLVQLGALDESGSIGEIGRRMAVFPLSASLGRVLIAAAEGELDCTAEVIDIISCLTVENIFLNITSEEKKEEAEAARRDLSRREGDHLTYLNTVQAYVREQSDRKAWASRHFVNHRAMQAVMDARKQLRAQCEQMGVLKESEPNARGPSSSASTEMAMSILKAFLKGFTFNTARLCPDGGYKTVVGHQNVAIHPSSGMFGRRLEAILFDEFVYTNRSYARGVSAVQMDWIVEAMGN